MVDEENNKAGEATHAAISATAAGLQIGIVRKIDTDPLAATRVLLELPLIDSDGSGVWARVGSPYATRRAGIMFMPEIGDEVLVGFVNNDPQQPVVLGSVYGSNGDLPYPPDAANANKGISTRGGLRITLQDDDNSVTIETPGGQVMVMSDKTTSISITDSHQNNVQLSSSGISLTSPKDISIKASGTLTLQGETGVSINSSNTVQVKGAQIDAQASTSLTLTGTATARLSAAGEVDIKGAIVMIN